MKLLAVVWLLLNSLAYPCVLNRNVDFNFVASSAIPFPKLMQQSMDIMDVAMSRVDMKAKPEKAFLEMMMAHHLGAVHMANTIIVHSKDENLRNFAISIVMTQKNEIELMKTMLSKQNK